MRATLCVAHLGRPPQNTSGIQWNAALNPGPGLYNTTSRARPPQLHYINVHMGLDLMSPPNI